MATDIAARGIDVSQISHVINYDIPDTSDAYIHRIGRTGRAARSGDAFTLITDEDSAMVRSIEQVLKAKIERRTIEAFDYKVPAPRKDAEFARPPREPRPQPRAKTAQPKPAANKAAVPAVSKSKPVARPDVVKAPSGNPAAPGSSRHPRRAGRAR